jgi:peptidoglycan/xylan/chitin deacetylase (PgdA/CDA1 family)
MSGSQDGWPISERAAKLPEGWQGWPQGKQFALVLTHDVDTRIGVTRCQALADIDKRFGFRSSFNFCGKEYPLNKSIREELVKQGFEIGLHGLKHKGNFFRSERYFFNKLSEANRILREWQCVGFRAPSMYHNLSLAVHLDIQYDSSTFDVDPFEPQSDGVETIFPFWVPSSTTDRGYVEMPYTLPQDFTVFIMLQETNIDIWKKKLDWIAEKGGMALLNTHPDYMRFNGEKPSWREYPAGYYEDLLEYINQKYKGLYWHDLPRDVASFWKDKYRFLSHRIRC